MGSDFIEVQEAAELLGVLPRSVYYLVRRGLLHPKYTHKKGLRSRRVFIKDEVLALAELRERKLTFQEVAAAAMQSHIAVRALERRVEMLEMLLNSRHSGLSLKEEDVIAVYASARQAIEAPPSIVEDIMHWASVFLSMGEEFLEAAEMFTGDAKAWKVFLDLGSATLRDAPLGDLVHDKELEAAYGYFRYARENLRRVALFHVRNRYGEKTARSIFTSPIEDAHVGVLRLLGGTFNSHHP